MLGAVVVAWSTWRGGILIPLGAWRVNCRDLHTKSAPKGLGLVDTNEGVNQFDVVLLPPPTVALEFDGGIESRVDGLSEEVG